MNDLISRSALIAEYDRVHKGEPGEARKLMENAPAVYAVPVRHGHWIFHEDSFGECDYVECSECRDDFVCWEADCAVTNYCPSCGADMRERKTNDSNND